MPERQRQLHHWLERQLRHDRIELRPASADASFRRYFRVTTPEGVWVAMDAPPDKEDIGPFLHVAARLLEHGLHAPAIHAADEQLGFMLLEDLGATHFLARLEPGNADALYGDALAALLHMQTVDTDGLPVYDGERLRQEMDLFPHWYLGTHLGVDLNDGQLAGLERVFQRLVDNALAQEQVFVHRDFHSRNLMLCERNNPGIIDFQDAVRGPVTYDLVSLLRDCYIAWPRARVEAWVADYHRRLRAAGLTDATFDTFLRWFDLMGIQRHLKAIGIFARLNHRDGKPGYLDDIPRTLGYVAEVSRRHEDMQPLHELLAELALLPTEQACRSA